ncbi:3-ketoacyl-ACP reductase [Rhodobacter sp. NTK016B]|uniref:3-ketoacyl-ACP reductase n=1 Tax=Rhodobacter sp. NTK016B TaxID=2759676 RepID=UPI001A8FF100|nr:3-ketoacyl-ACP reductase [Rhodobacter sp. NTK016B]MBN8292136.1 3-ketoacyl-ACP reductase [Rhodobacter sp. NTK016B]
MENDTLHDRLQALGQKIHNAEEKLREQAHWHHDSAHLTAKELKERYARLQARLNGEFADAEAHGRHVSDLERSVQQWVESFDTAYVSPN